MKLLLLSLLLLLCGCAPQGSIPEADASMYAFCPIEEQSLDPVQAAADGCVVLDKKDKANSQNTEQILDFVEKSQKGIPSMMRVLYGGSFRDGIYDGTHYIYRWYTPHNAGASMRVMQFEHWIMQDGEPTLSVFSAAPDADWPFLYGLGNKERFWFANDLYKYLNETQMNTLCKLIEEDTASRIPSMTAWSEDGNQRVELRFEDGEYVLETHWTKRYSVDEDHPVYVVNAGGDLFGIVFAMEDSGFETRIYDAAARKYTETYLGDVKTIVQQLSYGSLTVSADEILTHMPILVVRAENISYIPGVGGSTITRYRSETASLHGMGDDYGPPWDNMTEVPVGALQFDFLPAVAPSKLQLILYPDSGAEQYEVELVNGQCTITEPGTLEIKAAFEKGNMTENTYFYYHSASYGIRVFASR